MLRPVSLASLPIPVPGWPLVFRGSTAVSAGLVTPGRLRGRAFVRLYPDIYAPTGDEPPDLTLRSTGAYLFARGRGVLSGYSAAELHGASCGKADAPAEITVPGGGVHACPGLVVRRDRLMRDEVQNVAGVLVTTRRRAAYDLARTCPDIVDAVAAVDALSRTGKFAPEDVLRLAQRYPRARGRRRLPEVVGLANRRAGSPMETRLRLLLVLRGLPRPEVQWVVQDVRRRRAVWLDLAYPEQRIGIEYEGEEHTKPARVLRDIGRGTDLVDQGWRLYRFTKYEVYGEPDEIVAKIERALGA
jgi:very-short-patch-repair endonuclease